MIVVLFELQALPGQGETYVDLVNKLTPLLEPMSGFISVECFQSTLNPKKVMSVTTWRDEEAVVQWRNVTAHLSAQRAGRDKIFDDYRVRVTSVIRDYGLRDREQAPYNVVVDGEPATAAAVV
ncbi:MULTISPECIES: antibiotic biosynthesis monooxygenase family protein [unclassified Pseudomonas]|jgi:heme-degrading monooxygenase HmoA|uniref:antibiotic biosynthesis monooxygenase family protein n=1 Tax=unclassified Pseudomonas TaxID=196821 RepID=UPI00026F9F25|nr:MULTISPECIES: antibiotic biosynthesis monooxygenase [unclassified Pseudomonas]EJM59065.1 putative enzyme involved in biosynthesis of extracellular polysaccharides [Pseudomonas sp. GM48]EJN24454.1 putative enzyme involved in biosynthesis of extracellular polysaccharide [Pseudomonas sp. GM79]